MPISRRRSTTAVNMVLATASEATSSATTALPTMRPSRTASARSTWRAASAGESTVRPGTVAAMRAATAEGERRADRGAVEPCHLAAEDDLVAARGGDEPPGVHRRWRHVAVGVIADERAQVDAEDERAHRERQGRGGVREREHHDGRHRIDAGHRAHGLELLAREQPAAGHAGEGSRPRAAHRDLAGREVATTGDEPAHLLRERA